MRVGEAPAAEVGHRIGLDPNDVVQDPKAEILQDLPDPVDVVVRADDPQRSVGFEQAAAAGQPSVSEGVVVLKAVEPIPGVLDALDACVIGPPQLVGTLEKVRRVGENNVDAGLRESGQDVQAIAGENLVEGSAPSLAPAGLRRAGAFIGYSFRTEAIALARLDRLEPVLGPPQQEIDAGDLALDSGLPRVYRPNAGDPQALFCLGVNPPDPVFACDPLPQNDLAPQAEDQGRRNQAGGGQPESQADAATGPR